jgi:hypothetical protein
LRQGLVLTSKFMSESRHELIPPLAAMMAEAAVEYGQVVTSEPELKAALSQVVSCCVTQTDLIVRLTNG